MRRFADEMIWEGCEIRIYCLILRLSFAYPSLIVRSLFALNKLCLVIKKAQDIKS